MINWFKNWKIIRVDDYENIINELVEISANLDTLAQESKDLQSVITSLSNRNMELSAKIMAQTKVHDVNDSEYWNNKWIKKVIYYAAPKKNKVTAYLNKPVNKAIVEIAKNIISNNNNSINNESSVILAVMKWVDKEKFKYGNDIGEVWKKPEQVLKDKRIQNDCDDIGILEYYLCREIFKQLNKWDKVKHRLKCVCGNVNRPYGVPSSAGGHFYLIWLANDCNWYVMESTYYRNIAISKFLNSPIKLNPTYGTMWFTFNEEYSWAQNSLVIEKQDFYKEKI
jgi:hypothetical protein